MNMKQKSSKIFYAILIFACFTFCYSNQMTNSKISCYILNVTDTSAIICWRWNTPNDILLVYGKSLGYSDTIKCSEELLYVNLSDLSPGTRYYYNIIVDKKSVLQEPEKYHFYTSPEDKRESFTFAVIGDTRTGDESFSSDHIAVIESIKNFTNPIFLLHLGDMVDITEKNSWDDFFNIESGLLKQCPIFPVRGNSDGTVEDFVKRFHVVGNNPWYSFLYGSVFCINLSIPNKKSLKFYKTNIGINSPQYAWLAKELKSENRKKSSFTIVSFFAPLFSVNEKYTNFLKETLCPLFENTKVDLVLNGGMHYFSHTQNNGIPYILSGGGGAGLQRPKKSSSIKTEFTYSAFHHLRMSVLYPVFTIDAIDNGGTMFFTHSITAHTEKNILKEINNTGEMLGSGISLTLFGAPNCEECTVFKNEIFPLLENKNYSDSLTMTFINVDEDVNFNQYTVLEKQLGGKKHIFPVLKIRNTLISEKNLTFDYIDSLLQYIISEKDVSKITSLNSIIIKFLIFVGVIIIFVIVILIILKKGKKK